MKNKILFLFLVFGLTFFYAARAHGDTAGYSHTCVNKSDGTVFCWGYNSHGQLGNNSASDSYTPVQVEGVGGTDYLTGVSQVEAGNFYTCALKSNGTVFCWGQNSAGELGDGSNSDRYTPVQVKSADGAGYLTGVSQLAAGSYHVCALKSDNTVFCWGNDDTGQLGNGSTTRSFLPLQVLGAGGIGQLTDISQLAAGDSHTCALKSDGTVFCWGYNENGQLGDNSFTNHLIPVQTLGEDGVGKLTGISQVVAGSYHTCAIKSDGRVFCWGDNAYGELGNHSTLSRPTPVQVWNNLDNIGTFSDVSQLIAGDSDTCALKSDGTVFCWGDDNYGQLGNIYGPTQYPYMYVPTEVQDELGTQGNLSNVGRLIGGKSHNCAIKLDGSVFCWGGDWLGQLGNNSTENSEIPVGVVDMSYLNNVSHISGGDSYTCSLKSDGTVFCWGWNVFGQLGNNSTTDSQIPVQVVDAGGSGHLTGVSQVASGGYHTCALKSDGTVFCWGDNVFGALGNNSTTNSSAPVQVQGLTDASQIVAGLYHTCAIKTDGSVYCWGDNGGGQLGNDSTDESLIPVQVLGVGGSGYLTGASQLATGLAHTCALKSNGTVFCWGGNNHYQLGDNSDVDMHTPVQVVGAGGSGVLGGVSQIEAEWTHTCVTISNGTVFCWGGNDQGELGINSTDESPFPAQVLGVGGVEYLIGVDQITTGLGHTCALKSNGTVFCWGANWSGQLGDNSNNNSLTPVQVTGVGGGGTLIGVNQLAAGLYHTCGLKSGGTVFCWGGNSRGQLGNNSINDSSFPVQVQDPATIEYFNLGSFSNTYTLSYAAGSKGAISGTAHQTVDKGDNGTAVTAEANSGYDFVNWSDGSTQNPRTDIDVSRDIRVTANFSPFVLTYSAESGGFLLGASPQTVDTGNSGSPVTAVPDSGYRFLNWSDGSTDNPRTDTDVSDDITVTANFTVESSPFYAVDSFSPVVKTIDSSTFESLDSLDITASNNQAIDGANGATVDPTTNEVYVVLRLLAPNGRYLAQLDMDSGLATVIGKLNRNFAAIAFDSSGQLYGLTGDGDTTNPSTLYSINKATAGITLLVAYTNDSTGETLTYNPDDNKLYRATQTEMFAIDPSDPGHPQTVYSENSLLPNVITGLMYFGGTNFNLISSGEVYSIDSATGEGGYLGSMDISTKSTFIWEPASSTEYTLTYTAGVNGSITGTTPQTVAEGADGSAVTAVADPGYHFVNWSDASTQNPRTDTNVTTNKSVTANFAINTYTLTYTAGVNGSITGTSPQTVNYNTSGTAVTASPAEGYHFVNWSDSSIQNPRTDSSVQSNVNVTASFASNSGSSYTLTYTAGTGGTISGTTPQTVSEGGSGTAVTAMPGTGHHFVNWSDSSTQNPRTDSNVMANKSVTANFALDDRIVIDPTPQKILAEYSIGVITIQDGSTLNTSKAILNTNVTFKTSGGASLVVPSGTQITKNGSGDINIENFTIQDIASTIRATVPSSKGAIKIGILNTPLSFTHEVAVSFPVDPSYNDKILTVYSRPDGGTGWTYETTCLVTDSLCSFNATHATEYTGNAEVSNSPDPTHVNVDINATITIDCKDANTETNDYIAMNPITGTGQSALNTNNDVNCNVITNNSSGYTLSFASSVPELKNANADTISAYTPGTINTPETWSVSSASSEWGARLLSSSSTYSSTLWGTAGTDSYTAKWYAVTNSNSFTLANRSTETAQTGDNQIIRFGAEIGASKFQPTGTYSDTVTFTAVTN